MIIAPGKVLNQLLETGKQLHNGEHPECVVTFGDHISLTMGNSTDFNGFILEKCVNVSRIEQR